MALSRRVISAALFLAAAPLAAAAAALPLRCGASTETSIQLQWAEVSDTDLYAVHIAKDASTRALALQTTPLASVTLIDLVPGTDYYLTVRSHPAADNIVWGWRAPTGPPLKCSTAKAERSRPNGLRRIGDAPHESAVVLRWTPTARTGSHSVGTRRVGEAAWRWEPADTADSHTAAGLASGLTYEVCVRDDTSGAISEPLLMRTAAPGVIYTAPYRISEYTFEVDFLQ